MLQLLEEPQDRQAWEKFLGVGFSSKENETYRYVRLNELYSTPFHPPVQGSLPEPQGEGSLVFVNGAFYPHLSSVPKPLIALPLKQAFKTYGGFLTSRMQRLLKEESDPFSLLNHAFFAEGLFLYLPPNGTCKEPIKIIHFMDATQPTHYCPRIHLFVGKGGALNLSFSQNIPSQAWVNSVCDCALEEGATLNLTFISEQHESAHACMALRATLKARSNFKSFAVNNGGATSRHDYKVSLQGEGGSASLYGVWDVKGRRQHHVNVWMEHQQPFCHSLQKFKGVVADLGRSSFEGKIYVHKEAQKTEAYQRSSNLLLSESASAFAKPNLEIFADDVKASHGATFGNLDAEHLFYLTARGIPLTQARALLIQGFTHEILDAIDDAALRQEACRVLG